MLSLEECAIFHNKSGKKTTFCDVTSQFFRRLWQETLQSLQEEKQKLQAREHAGNKGEITGDELGMNGLRIGG